MLDLLAAHPRTCPDLLTALSGVAARGHHRDLALAVALAGNPAVALRACHDLVSVHPAAAPAVFARPDVRANDAIEFLGPRPNVDVARAALAHVHDPDGALVEHVRSARSGSIHLCSDIVDLSTAPTDARVRAAGVLVAHWQITPGDGRRIARLVRALMLASPVEGAAVTRDLLEASVTRDVASALTTELDYLERPPVPGTLEWFQDPATTAEHVVAWAQGKGKTTAWTSALRDHDDPTGAVAVAAMAAQRRPQRWPLERIVRSPGVPVALRQQAARSLHDGGWTQWSQYHEVPSLLAHADLEFLDWYLALYPVTGPQVGIMSGRADLTGDLVSALDRARQLLAGSPQPHNGVSAQPGWTWDMWLLTHPNTPPTLRAEAGDRLQRAPKMSAGPAWLTAFARAAVGGDVVRARDLPLEISKVAHGALVRSPGGRLMLAEALDELTDVARGPQAAAALIALAPTFTGTYGELADTLRVLTTT